MWQQRERTIEDAFGGEEWVEAGGLYIPAHAKPKRPRPGERPTAVDFFCGAGGMSLGLIQGGFEVVAGFDSDCAAAVTYMYNLGAHPIKVHFATQEDQDKLEGYFEKNYGRQKKGKGIEKAFVSGAGMMALHQHEYLPVTHYFFGDVRKWTGAKILELLGRKKGEITLVAGGPPCQGFSQAGKRDVMDPRNSLVFEFARLVLEIFPTCMVMENVPGILSMVTPDGLPVVDAFCRILEEGGFGSFDALRRTLTHNLNAKAAVRGSVRNKKDYKDEDEADESAQLSLF